MSLLASDPRLGQPSDADRIAYLEAVIETLHDEVPASVARGFDDDTLLRYAAVIEKLGRYADAGRVTAAGEVAERSRPELQKERLSAKKGCRNPQELLERVTLVSGATARQRMALGGRLRPRTGLIGNIEPPQFPAVAAAVEAGALGIDSAEAILKGLVPALPRARTEHLLAGETELVAAGTGDSPDSPVPVTPDELRVQAAVWRAALDPDGVRPDENHAMLKRGFRFGLERDGLIPVTGALMPEIAGRMMKVMDAYLSPKTAPVAFIDEEARRAGQDGEPDLVQDLRTTDQKRHDILAVIVDTAARAAETPTVGGAAPTVLVSVREKDLLAGKGVGHMDGIDTPLSMETILQMVCAGGLQKVVLTKDGEIVELGTEERCFNRAQRRAIMLRDGTCIIPGCQIPATWTEIHHVTPDALGGPTETSNGVCLCWFHHRTLDTSGWAVRMNKGAPEIKAPPWLDHERKWRPVTKAPTRLADQLDDRYGERFGFDT